MLESKRELAFPESVVDLIAGRMGQPPGGFPAKTRAASAARTETARRGRPAPACRRPTSKRRRGELEEKLGRKPTRREVLSYLMFPKVFAEFVAHQKTIRRHQRPADAVVFLRAGCRAQEVTVEIEKGKTLIVKFLTVGDPHPDGRRTVFFELNGLPRERLRCRTVRTNRRPCSHPKADTNDPAQVGAPMPGESSPWPYKPATPWPRGQKLLSMEAMKMETTVYAEHDGKVAEVLVRPGTQIETGDLLVRFE